MEYFLSNDYDTIITFGGAFSNHIHAVASAGQLFGIDTVGVIRGEEDVYNPTLIYARSCGMKLHFIDRESYRQKENSDTFKVIKNLYNKPYLIPEGGTNNLAIKGTRELCTELYQQLNKIDFIGVSVGTGGTVAGMLDTLEDNSSIIAFSSLKGNFLKNEIEKLTSNKTFVLNSDFHFGGYGRTTSELIEFINSFYDDYNIILDPIYNGKGVFGLLALIESGYFPRGSNIVWVCTGGQQGNIAWNYMNKTNSVLPTI